MNPSKFALILIGLHGPVLAGQDCSEIEDNQERLACYDASNPKAAPALLPDAAKADPAPASRQAVESSAPVEAGAPEQFGTKEIEERPNEYIEARIVEVKESANRHYLRLDNGQVWREIEDGTLRFKEGRKVTITEGILNSFDLKMEGQNAIVKVKRVK